MWIYLKPINSTAVDEGWKLPQPVTESIANWTECNHNMHILLALFYKEVKQSEWSKVITFVTCLSFGTDSLQIKWQKKCMFCKETILICNLTKKKKKSNTQQHYGIPSGGVYNLLVLETLIQYCVEALVKSQTILLNINM